MGTVPTMQMQLNTCKITVNVADRAKWEAQGWAAVEAAADEPTADTPAPPAAESQPQETTARNKKSK